MQTQARRTIQGSIDPVASALHSLAANEEALALAKIVRVAEPFASAAPVMFALFDCGALASNRLDDLIFDAARDFDLERDDLPARPAIIHMLCATNPPLRTAA